MELKEFFSQYKKIAVAFSGGADSAYLLSCAKKYALDVKAYFLKSSFQPEFELEDALRLADELSVKLCVINVDLSKNTEILKNTELRCYYCKQNMFGVLKERANADGYYIIADGTNASDSLSDRPGMRALKEMGVLSPLRACGLTKDDIYRLSKEEGLFTCNKPSYSCLATRIPTGMAITGDMLKKIERAEMLLFSLGFSDFRFRVESSDRAKIQLRREQHAEAEKHIEKIRERLKDDFSQISIDKEVFR